MATKKSRLVIAIILMLSLVSFFSIPATVFADDIDAAGVAAPGTPTVLTLNVQYGGIAIVGTEYSPGSYPLNVLVGDILNIKPYSNAGYVGSGEYPYIVSGTANESVTVGFAEVVPNEVYGQLYYVTNGYFSGYNPEGIDNDIAQGHDPKNDVLEAAMVATPDKSVYGLGETAKVSLNVTVLNGDGNTKILNEVDFYENEIESSKQTYASSPSSSPVAFTTTIPTSESALVDAGFVLTTDGTYKIYTKPLSYDLVDRYNNNGASAILVTAKAELVLKFKIPANLWIASDDFADVYIEGYNSFLYNTTFEHVTSYVKPVGNDPFVAAKASDTSGQANISGFKLVLQKEDGKYLSTNNSWFYYNKPGREPGIDSSSNNWFDRNYKAQASDWSIVTSFTLDQAPLPRTWAPDSEFYDNNATWIWSPNYNVDEDSSTPDYIDTPVYLRSIAPLPLTGDIIINKDVTTNNVAVSELNTNNVLDQTVFTFKIWNAVSNGEGWVKGTTEFAIGAPFTASEATPRVVHNVPYGNYIVEEVGYNGYTPAYLTDFVTVPSNDNQSNVAYFENALNPLLNVTFDPQNGESSTSIGGIASGATVALPPNPSNGASTFNGWNTASDGSGLTFTELTPVLNNITVYAQWVSETITTTRNRTSTVVVPVEPTPAGPVIIPVIDEQVPAAPLPKTGGLDPSFLYGLGALLATGGLVIRKRKDK